MIEVLKDAKFIPETKPIVTGPVDGNVFTVIGAAKRALKRANLKDAAEEMAELAMHAESYDHALGIVMEYVDFDI